MTRYYDDNISNIRGSSECTVVAIGRTSCGMAI